MCSTHRKSSRAQAEEHAAPELRVAADAVMRVRTKRPCRVVEPRLRRPIAQLLPDGRGIPVLGFLRARNRRARRSGSARRCPASACAMRAAAGAAADDDDVVTARSRCTTDPRLGVDLIHQPLVVDGPLEAHLRLPAFAIDRGEVAIHRLVAADVPKAREIRRGSPLPRTEDEESVGFERDDAFAAEQLRQPEAAEERRNLARVVERADGAVVVA